MTGDFLEALRDRVLQAAAYAKDDQVAPAAILWPDAERQWEPLIPALRDQLPIVMLGDYDPATRTGPSYYLRCMVARTLDDRIAEDETPVLYLPGVSKQELRAAEEAPQLLKPLAELQYRGTLFTQKNGRDWTIAAFIQSNDGGLGIEVGADAGTKAAILGVRSVLAGISVDEMRRNAPLRADFFNEKLQPDLARNLLMWLSDPAGYEASSASEAWDAFRAQCRSRYHLDPATDGPISMARDLGLGPSDAWETAWRRFAESPGQYPGIPERLRAARPKPARNTGPQLWDRPGRWPQENDEAEAALRDALRELGNVSPGEARVRLAELEREHAPRREWVWSQLGQAPLAHALEHLAELASGTSAPLTGSTVATLAEQYADGGWRTDDAVLRSLAAVDRQQDVLAVKAAVRTVYKPWLEACAEAFQKAADGDDFASAYPQTALPAWPIGTCVVFCDGLRLDLAHRLAETLKSSGKQCDLTTRLTALPSITGTAKPAVSPVAALFGSSTGLDPAVIATGSVVNVGVLRTQLETNGYQVLQGEDVGDPSGRAWAEAGDIDEFGHKQPGKLPSLADGEVRRLAERIDSLLEAGWKQVVVVTDHGWLYLPGDLPKAELEIHLAGQNMRKGRCARLKPAATTDFITVPWHWDSEVQIAMAPGICCFQQGKTYEHGGLSPQECVTPVLTVTNAVSPETGAVATLKVTWRGLRCSFETEYAPSGATVDIRSKAGDATTSLPGQPRALRDDGTASAPIADDGLLGLAAFAVLLGPAGEILAQTTTTVGGDD